MRRKKSLMEEQCFFFVMCVVFLFNYNTYAAENRRESSSGIPGTSYKTWQWTDWFDTDIGPDEIETYQAIVARGWKLCLDSELVGSECLREDTGAVLSDCYFFNTSYLIGSNIECKLHGVECHNVNCMNFKVRFLCEGVVIETGSAVFYFLILIIPIIILLFRLYCWEFFKKRIHKRYTNTTILNTENQSESVDVSSFDPPKYNELFGAQIEWCSETGIMICTRCHNIKTRNIQDNTRINDNSSVDHCNDISTTGCLCACSVSVPVSNTQNEAISGTVTTETNSGYIHDNCIGIGETMNGDISIHIITSNFEETPPPGYSEALVILKRQEGLDATHL